MQVVRVVLYIIGLGFSIKNFQDQMKNLIGDFLGDHILFTILLSLLKKHWIRPF